MSIPLLAELETELAAVTDRDVARAGRALGPAEKADLPLGVVHNLEARRLWAASVKLATRGLTEQTLAATESDSDEEERLHEGLARRAGDLAELARNLFWAQAKDDLIIWHEGTIGLRSGWMIVRRRPGTAQSAIEDALKRGIG